MRGTNKIARKKTTPDSVYHSELITKLINYVMQDGKKVVSQKLVYGALQKVADETKENPIEVLQKAMANITPKVEAKSRRIGGANYSVPIPVPEYRGLALALRWLIEGCRERTGKNFDDILAEELLLAYKNTGVAVKKRENVEKMAEANKAFAQFRL